MDLPVTIELKIEFEGGTIVVRGAEEETRWEGVPDCQWDKRIGAFRLPGYRYYNLIRYLCYKKIPFQDCAKSYIEITLTTQINQMPFEFQTEGLESWKKNNKRGYITLPTGAGKTFLAILAIASTCRSTLILVPTIDLMNQWYDTLKLYFDTDIGLIGGGYYEITPLTVTTYDSAYIYMEKIGNRFGLIVFDECHHLPGPSYQMAAQCAIAPFRLGLSATPEREDGRHHLLDDLIGPCVYRKDIRELSGSHLAEYDVVRIFVSLSAEERKLYEQERAIYINFIKERGIFISKPGGWQDFLCASCQSPKGRRAFLAYRQQKLITQATPSKVLLLERLLQQHRKDKVLIFTNDNKTVYTISERFLIPAITHQTLTKERRDILIKFNEGVYPALVTSKVLNEGINVPEANVGIVLSGSGSVREHVQRLGRILRKVEQKRALLYEFVTADTGEMFTSDRRRDHDAYR